MKTKSIIFCSFILYIFSSCENTQKQSRQYQVDKTAELSIENEIKKVPFSKITVITYDQCEYLIYKEEFDSNETLGFMAHKGNCKNPIHCKTE